MPDEKEIYDSTAKEAIQLFRVNLFIIAVYLPVVGLLSQENGTTAISRVLSSTYTLAGIIIWLGTLGGCVLIYAESRRVFLFQPSDSGAHMKIISMGTISLAGATFFAVFFLFFGVINGFAAVPLYFPLLTLVVSALFISVILSLTTIAVTFPFGFDREAIYIRWKWKFRNRFR